MPLPPMAGVSLKSQHYQDILALSQDSYFSQQAIGWFEIHPENYFGDGGEPHYFLEKISTLFPISMHGVGLSLGSTVGLSLDHLNQLRKLSDRYKPAQISEHLSWSVHNGKYLNDLLPSPYTNESFQTFKNNINQAQESLRTQILIENPSIYLDFNSNTLEETDFINQLCQETGCGILLDINNVSVSTYNSDEYNHIPTAKKYLESINYQHVGEIHLAGHKTLPLTESRQIRVDDHGSAVCDEVWSLYEHALLQLEERIPTLIEWDTDVPHFEVLSAQASKAQNYLNKYG